VRWADGAPLLASAEKDSLSAFLTAVNDLFDAEQARRAVGRLDNVGGTIANEPQGRLFIGAGNHRRGSG